MLFLDEHIITVYICIYNDSASFSGNGQKRAKGNCATCGVLSRTLMVNSLDQTDTYHLRIINTILRDIEGVYLLRNVCYVRNVSNVYIV